MAQQNSSLLSSSGGHQMELSMSDGGFLNSNSVAAAGSASNGTALASHANGHGTTSPSRGQNQRGGRNPKLSFPRSSRNSVEGGQKRQPSRQVSFGKGVTVPDGKVYETLQKEEKGPKSRRNRKKHGCLWGLSKSSWLFLLLALGQAILITGLQIAIAILGEFRENHIDAYVSCLEDSFNISIPDNATFPSFGRDKESYIYLFIALMVYSFALCLYALIFQNIVEIYTFLIINVLAMSYASVQVYQFRGFGRECSPITLVGWLAFANVMTLLVFTIVFALLSFFIYVEFGWKIYTLVNCNSTIRYYYRVYEVYLSGVKLLILFMVIFCIAQCILLLQGNYEFGLTILLAIVVVALYGFAYYGVRHESFLISLGLLIANLLAIGYNTFKIYRYVTRSCPLCIKADEERRANEEDLMEKFNTSNIDFVQRTEEFQHLVMIGAMNLITAVIVLVIFLHLWRQYGKGLKDYFDKQSTPFSKWCQCLEAAAESETDTTDSSSAPHTGGLILRLWSSSKRKRKRKSENSKRDSGLEEGFTPVEPEFGIQPTNPEFFGSGVETDIERGTQGVYRNLATIPEESGGPTVA